MDREDDGMCALESAASMAEEDREGRPKGEDGEGRLAESDSGAGRGEEVSVRVNSDTCILHASCCAH